MKAIVKDNEIIIELSENKTATQKSEMIGETDKYIVSLITNEDNEGKLTWLEIFFTEKDE